VIPLLLLFQLWPPGEIATFHEQRIARLKTGTPEARAAHKDLGLYWLKNANPAEAEAHLRQALPDPEITPFLAEAVAAQGRGAEAEALFEECGPKARCLSRLAQMAESRSDGEATLRYLREALDAEPTAARRNDLAQALEAAGQTKQAEALYRQAIREQQTNPGTNHPETAITQNNLASLLNATGRLVEAEALQRQALATVRKTLGPRHVRTGLAASNLADILRARGREPEARALYQKARQVFEEALPPGHPWTLEAREALQTNPRN
jgi:tetratricopeptide (TPR) repeat protein